MKVYFYTLGCKVNQYETETMAEQFEQAGYTVSADPEDCDIVVVNSCTVTAVSDQKTRQAVRRFKRNRPTGLVVLTGCMPQAFPAQAEGLAEADIVVGNKDHRGVVARVQEYFAKSLGDRSVSILPHESGELFENLPIKSFGGRSRVFVKVQDGCNRFCSYCIIPYARGRSRSRSLEDLEAELRQIKAAGHREVVLVGINFCCYGLDNGHSFVDPIALACGLGFDRVRIGSLEFDNISDKAITELSKLPNFCPQFHISLQSGCDNTLKAMNRHYTAAEYKELCTKLRRLFPDAAITTDLMVGFPGETEEDFVTSMNFAKEIGFEKIHVFPYSSRPGTKAAELPQLSKAVKAERAHRMIAVAEELRTDYLSKQVGKEVEILAEAFHGDHFTGYTKNYIPVRVTADHSYQDQLVTVRITGANADECFGELL